MSDKFKYMIVLSCIGICLTIKLKRHFEYDLRVAIETN